MTWLVKDVLSRVPKDHSPRVPVPPYLPSGSHTRVGLAVESMRRHTSSEGFELFKALEHAGYTLCGYNLPLSTPRYLTDVREILDTYTPGTMVIQDVREYTGRTGGPGFDQRERFTNLHLLRNRPDVFKVSVIKDAQKEQVIHRDAALEADFHAWLVYYSPEIVAHLNGFVRPEHLVRMYHTGDASIVPRYSSAGRAGCVISGFIHPAYPLRTRLVRSVSSLPETTVLSHPGYGRRRCYTPEYLHTLSRFKVAIQTASRYGYLLRKIIEGVACGCTVITDLPEDDVVPEVDECLVRVHPDSSPESVADVIRMCLAEYDPERAEHYARKALERFDYRTEGVRLAGSIEALRALRASYSGVEGQ